MTTNPKDLLHENIDRRRDMIGPFEGECRQARDARKGPYVYVAGPITIGNPVENHRKLLDAAERLFQAGCVPFCPGIHILWEFAYPHTAQEWLSYDMRWIEKCDAVLVLDGPSKGAAVEVHHAMTHLVPVFTTEGALLAHFGLPYFVNNTWKQ